MIAAACVTAFLVFCTIIELVLIHRAPYGPEEWE